MTRIESLLESLCPNGVEYVPIDRIATCVAGATPSRKRADYWDGGTIPWMNSGDVNKRFVSEVDGRITQLGYDKSSTHMLPVNTVVIALAGQGKTRGTVAITRIPLCTNQSLCGLVLKDKRINSDFLFHYLNSQYMKLREISSGDGTRGGLNLKMIRAYRVPIPPMEVQEEIVALLNAYSANLASLEKAILFESRQREMQYAFYSSKIIDRYCRSAQRGTLDELVEIRGRIGFRGYKRTDQVAKGEGAISITPGNLFNGVVSFDNCTYISWAKYEESPEIMVSEGDVLFVKTGSTVGKVAQVESLPEKATINPQMVVFKNCKCNPKYLCYYLQSPAVQDEIRVLAGIGSVPNISQAKLGSVRIPLISEQEQESLVVALDQLSNANRDLTTDLSHELELRRSQYAYYQKAVLSFQELKSKCVQLP